MSRYDIAIIGGGILGTTISYWISSLYDVNLCVIEKEPNVAMHASSRNTAVVHSPFYLDPKTKKVLARSALISYDMWEKLLLYFCCLHALQHLVPFQLHRDLRHKEMKSNKRW